MEIAFPISVQFENSEARSPKTPRDIAAPHQNQIASVKPNSQVFNDNNVIVDYRNYKFPPLEPLSMIKYDNYVGPTLESNWVVPGVLLVGAYPASQDDDETFQIISSILKHGVTKFVCLQEEYRPTGVTEAMWRSGQALRPYFEDVKLIVKNRSRFETFKGHHNIVSDDRLSFVHFPIRDCSITDDSGVLQLARNLVKAISEGEVIYLHCWGGHGRTGTVLCIMLHLMYGLTPQEAMHRCQTVHDLRVYPVDVGSPQTQQQRDQVTRVITKLMETSEYTRTVGIGAPVPIKMFRSSIPSMPTVSSPKTPMNSYTQQLHTSYKYPLEAHGGSHGPVTSYANAVRSHGIEGMEAVRSAENVSRTSQNKSKQHGNYLFGYKFFKSKKSHNSSNHEQSQFNRRNPSASVTYGENNHNYSNSPINIALNTATSVSSASSYNPTLVTAVARPPSSQQPSQKHHNHHRNQYVMSRAKENENTRLYRQHSIDLGLPENSDHYEYHGNEAIANKRSTHFHR